MVSFGSIAVLGDNRWIFYSSGLLSLGHQPISPKNNMKISTLAIAALLGAGSIASAQDLILAGHVQRVVLQPFGTENCPPPCPPPKTTNNPAEPQLVCVTNAGGCQMMEVKVSRVFRGADQGPTRQFNSQIGEWGPSFPVTRRQIVVRQDAGNVYWSFATEREGKIFVDPKRLGHIDSVSTLSKDQSGLVALDELLALSARRQ